ncbi:MAG: xylulokinase [Christensenellales bacterium]
MKYLVGIDIGTSGTKSIIADENGRVVASAIKTYPLHTPRPGWAEQDPADWWRAVIESLREIMPKVDPANLAGVSFSGQMHGLVALDANDEVIRPAMLWCDQRTQKQCDWLTAQAGGLEKLLTYTNNQMLTGYTGGKILWLREEEPENFRKMVRFVCPKDYIRFKITGKADIDVSDASGTGFFDTKNRRWSRALIDIAGLEHAIFPEVHESTELAGQVTAAAAALTGLPEGLDVYYGGGDAVIQAVGSGLVVPGTLGVVIGTAGNVSMGLDRYYDNPKGALQMFCSNEPGSYMTFGCTLTAGGAYQWYRDNLCENALRDARETGKNVYAIMDGDAAASAPGSNGVVFAPYLTGERCPYPDPNARAAFYGLTLGAKRADITRAVMEGVTFSLKQVADVIGAFAQSERVYISGGGSSSKLWRQMLADIFNLPVNTMSAASEGGAYGAVMVAGVGAGLWKNLAEAIQILSVETEAMPDAANRAAYRNAYAVYGDLYPALKPVFDKSAGFGW